MVPTCVNFLSSQAISRVPATCLPLLGGQNGGEGGYYAGPPKKAFEALLSSTTSGPRLAGVRQRQHSTMHIVDANLYKGHCGLMPRLILI